MLDTAPTPPTADTSRPATLTATLLERERELGMIDDLLSRAADGKGGLVLIEGAAGTGKSSLLEEAVARGRVAGMTVARARAHELERCLPWGVARTLLDPHAGLASGSENAAPPGPMDERWFAIAHTLYHSVIRIAADGGVLLTVDDAQWCDEPSLRFLVYVVRRLTQRPVAVVVAARSGERGAAGLLDTLAADQLVTVSDLGPLSAQAVAALVRERHPDADDTFCRRCHEITGGNPLELREILAATARSPRADLEGLCDAAELAARSLSRSVLRRLAALSPHAQSLARTVSVLEDAADPALAAEIAGISIEHAFAAVDELEAADLVRSGATLEFAHPLLRSAVYGTLRFSERASQHQRAARRLIARGACPQRVAGHLLESFPSGDPATVDVLRTAGRRALEQGAPTAAALYLERARREPPRADDRVAVLAELGRAEALAAISSAPASLEAAIEESADAHERAALLLDLARTLAQRRRMVESREAFVRGLELIGDDGSELALDLRAGYLTATMHVPEMAAEVQRGVAGILADTEALTTRARRGLASKAMIVRLFAADPHEETLAIARGIFAGGRLIDEDRVDSQALTHVVSTLGWCDDYAAADEAIRMTMAAAERSGSALAFATASQLRARQRLWTGPAEGALADARAAMSLFDGGGLVYHHSATYCLVWALLERNAVEGAAAVLERSEADAPGTGRSAWRHAARGILAARQGDDGAALDAFLACGRRLSGLLVHNPVVLPWRSEAGLAAYRLGRHEQARKLIAEELTIAQRFGAPRALAVARRAAALVDRDRGVELLRSAAASLSECGATLERARTMVELGAAIRRSGQPRAGREALREALDLAEATGSLAIADRARAELRLAGVPAAGSSGEHDELTASERRVAELAAAGRMNRQIADELFVTVKAVEWHLGNVYRKLRIRGRGELGAALTEQ